MSHPHMHADPHSTLCPTPLNDSLPPTPAASLRASTKCRALPAHWVCSLVFWAQPAWLPLKGFPAEEVRGAEAQSHPSGWGSSQGPEATSRGA